MSIVILNTILSVVIIYLVCGFFFAIPFVIKGAGKIDEDSHGSTWGFKIIIIPATIVFWPLLLKKWIEAGKTKNNG